MVLKKLLNIVKILGFIDKNPNCSVPRIRDYLQIQHLEPPSQDEKNLYKIITLLNKNEFINKDVVKKRELGGAHFTLEITPSGQNFLKQLGGGSEYIDPQEKIRIIDDLSTSIRLAIRSTLAGKISKPLQIEIVPELSRAITDTLQNTFKNILFLEHEI